VQGRANINAGTRIVVADDHTLVRRGICMLLDGEPDFEVVADVGDVDAVRRSVLGHRPEVLVLDLSMPGSSSLAAIADLTAEMPDTKIVVLTMQDDPAIAREAIRAGALGYVLKEAAADELVTAIRHAIAGKTYLNPQLGARIAVEPPPAPPDDLSETELTIIREVALGRHNHELAADLFLSIRTVELHRQRIARKLGLTRLSDLVGYALARGLLDGR
jgi:two-component system, NarL family, response regulator NreC